MQLKHVNKLKIARKIGETAVIAMEFHDTILVCVCFLLHYFPHLTSRYQFDLCIDHLQFFGRGELMASFS